MALRAIALFTLAGAISLAQAAPVTSVPASRKSVPPTPAIGAKLLLKDDSAARAIDLGTLTVTEKNKAAKSSSKRVAAATQGPKRGTPLRIGVARTVPASVGRIDLSALEWKAVDGGGTAAQVVVTSAGAAAVRLGLQVADAPPGLVLRFQGSAAPEQTFTSIEARTMPSAYPYWTPVLSGERAIVEMSLPEGVSPGSAKLLMPSISHLVANPASKFVGCSDVTHQDDFCLQLIGDSGSCERDVACTASPSPALLSAQSSNARIILTYSGSTYLCSATLVNDSTNSHTPYIYMANHCMDDFVSDELVADSLQPAEAAASINSYWFFQAATCGSLAVPSYVLLAGGAKLLARSLDYDWGLVQLKDATPASAAFSAWRAEPITVGTAVHTLHNPEGDLTKYSIGSTTDYITFSDGSSFIQARWTTQGATEPGSSGGGLFTLTGNGGAFELRGALFGGDSTCRNPLLADQYSRLDTAYPQLVQYLTPNAPLASGAMPVVEFYNTLLNDYFITIDPQEISDLDNNVHPNWIRTGFRFLAYPNPAVAPASATPVCRFYVLPAVGDSHFYSADPAECAATQAKFPDSWFYESAAVFYAVLPNKTTGVCPTGTHPVYRFLNNANGLHHRYTAEVDIRDLINDIGDWTQEGYGNPPDQVALCSPNT